MIMLWWRALVVARRTRLVLRNMPSTGRFDRRRIRGGSDRMLREWDAR